MNFPNNWISRIKTFLNSSSFSLLINGILTPWFTSFRGVCQRDPISSYLFILISQNLTSMLNFALRHNLIPGFNSNNHYNFNHLMFVDDLVLVTRASRWAAQNIKLCLSIYAQLTGQNSNFSVLDLFSFLV